MSNAEQKTLLTKYGSLIPDDASRALLAGFLGELQAKARGQLRLVQNTRDSHETLIFGPAATPTQLMNHMYEGAREIFGEGPITVRLTRMILCPPLEPDDAGYGLLMLTPEPGSDEYRRHATLKARLTALSPPDTRDVGTLRMRERIAAGASAEDAAAETMLPHFTIAVDPAANHADFAKVWPALADGRHVPVDLTIRCDEVAVSGSVEGTCEKFLTIRKL